MGSVNACYIEAEDTGGQYMFQFIPDTITDGKSASYNDYDIIGRSTPLKGYRGGGPRTLGFTVKLFAAPEQNQPNPIPAKIKEQVDWLLSLPYPDYSGGIKPPTRCNVVIGSQIIFTGVCLNASVTYYGNWPWDTGPGGTGPGLAHGAEVSLEFEGVDLGSPYDYSDMRGGIGA